MLRIACPYQTAGTNRLVLVGTGVAETAPIFRASGVGDNTIEVPSYVTKIRIRASYSGSGANFYVQINGQLVVAKLLGTVWSSTTYDGQHPITAGGLVRILQSNGVSWWIPVTSEAVVGWTAWPRAAHPTVTPH
jgi:hypothetical protein